MDVAKHTGPNGDPLVHIALMELGKKYNGLYGLWLGAQYTVVITKPSVAEECFCEHQLENGEMCRGGLSIDRAAFQSKGGHHVPTIRIMTRDGQGIGMSTGNYWKKVRGRMVAHITNPKVAERNAPMVMEEVNSVVWAWRQSLERGEPLSDFTGQLKRESMNMGMRMLFSQRFGAEMPEDYRTLQHAVEYIFKNMSSGNPSDMIPFLRVLPNKFLDEFQNVVDRRDEVLARIIEGRRKSFLELRTQGKMKLRSEARDIADLFFFDQFDGYEAITAGKAAGTIEKLTMDQVHVCIWDILFASTDTTAMTNEWAMYMLINNPDVQRKVHEELDRVVGPDRVPVLDDRENLPYFWAFLKEVFRYRLVSPIMAPRYSTQDMTLHDTTGKEFFVPEGTQLFLHGYSMALDPELWDEPEKFNPDRWLSGKERDLDLYGQVRRKRTDHYKFVPFSLGPRMCPGYSFAKVAQFIQTVTLVHAFNFKLTPDAAKIMPGKVVNGKVDLQENWGLTIFPQRFGENGCITADVRPMARLCKPLQNDIDPANVFLDDRSEKKVKLIVRKQISHDTVLLRFSFGFKYKILGLPIGKHIKVYLPNLVGVEPGKWNGKEDPEFGKPTVERAYTPTSSDANVGYMDLLVKIYEPKVNPRFPDGGKTSQQLGKLKIGDEITISGPYGLIEYQGKSEFKIGRNQVKKKFVGMMAGGSGITPMLQLLNAALEDPKDQTKFSLIYANQTPSDILCREELEDLGKRFPNKFKLHYTVDRAPADGSWKYSVGFIDAAMIEEHMPPKSEDTMLFTCGPPPMVQFAIRANVEKLGYGKEHLAVF